MDKLEPLIASLTLYHWGTLTLTNLKTFMQQSFVFLPIFNCCCTRVVLGGEALCVVALIIQCQPPTANINSTTTKNTTNIIKNMSFNATTNTTTKITTNISNKTEPQSTTETTAFWEPPEIYSTHNSVRSEWRNMFFKGRLWCKQLIFSLLLFDTNRSPNAKFCKILNKTVKAASQSRIDINLLLLKLF